MKRYLLLLLTAATLLWSTSSQAAGELGENGGNNTNPHNLSSGSGNNAYKAVAQTPPGIETQICIFCHVPHGATPASTLWNRPDPTGPTPPGDGTFPLLTNPALGISDSTVIGYSLYDNTSGNYPNGASKLCLSCHDGVTAMGILARNVTIDMTTPPTLSANFDIDLSTSHPISFVYNATVVGLLVAPPLSKSLQLPSTDYLETDGAGTTRVQCTSCHQPHQDTMASNGLPFWRVDTGVAGDYDTVCNACHTGATSGGTGHTGYP